MKTTRGHACLFLPHASYCEILQVQCPWTTWYTRYLVYHGQYGARGISCMVYTCLHRKTMTVFRNINIRQGIGLGPSVTVRVGEPTLSIRFPTCSVRQAGYLKKGFLFSHFATLGSPLDPLPSTVVTSISHPCGWRLLGEMSVVVAVLAVRLTIPVAPTRAELDVTLLKRRMSECGEGGWSGWSYFACEAS